MSQATSVRPAAKPRTQRMLDSVMRSMLRSPLHGMVSKKMLIITVCGRKTGRVYANLVGYVESDRVIIKGNPSHSKHSGITLDADGNVNADQLRRALDKGTAVVRLRPRQAA